MHFKEFYPDREGNRHVRWKDKKQFKDNFKRIKDILFAILKREKKKEGEINFNL